LKLVLGGPDLKLVLGGPDLKLVPGGLDLGLTFWCSRERWDFKCTLLKGAQKLIVRLKEDKDAFEYDNQLRRLWRMVWLRNAGATKMLLNFEDALELWLDFADVVDDERKEHVWRKPTI
jgi:hypothetical protein